MYFDSTLNPADYEDLAIEYMLRGDLLDEMLRQGRNYRFIKALGRRVINDDFEALGIPANDFIAARYADELVHDLAGLGVI